MARTIRSMTSIKKSAEAASNTIGSERILEIESSKIKDSPFNRYFPMPGREEFAESLKETGGPIETVIVYDLKDGTYELLSGHRRRDAWCNVLGHKTIKCRVREYPSDPKVRFAEHAKMNIDTREKDPFFWIAEIKNARDLITEGGFTGGEMEMKDEIHRLLGKGASPQQIARYEGFERLEPELQALTKYGLSITTLYAAIHLSPEDQKRLAKEVEDYFAEGDEKDLSRSEFTELVRRIKENDHTKGEEKPAKSKAIGKTFEAKTYKLIDRLAKGMSSAKTESDKQTVLSAIKETRLRLDEIERSLLAQEN